MIKGLLKWFKGMAGYVSVEPMSEITKANLELLIREIQDLDPNDAIKELLESWVKANGLHPEEIKYLDGLYYRVDIRRTNE